MLYLDTKVFMVSLNLNYNDKMSMASSVEVRVPFLDREFAGILWLGIVPPHLKTSWVWFLCPDHETYLSRGYARHSAPGGVKATEGWLRRSLW